MYYLQIIIIINPENLLRFTTDNIDIKDSSLGGKNSFHATQVVAWQRGPQKTARLASLRPVDKTNLVIPEALYAAADLVEGNRVPVFTEPVTLTWDTFFILRFDVSGHSETSASEPRGDRLDAS